MTRAFSAVAVSLLVSTAFCAAPYGIDRREVGEPYLGERFPHTADDFKNNDNKLPQLLSQTGIFEPFKPTGDLIPVKAMIPYTVNTPLWSDAASKLRWLYVPKDTAIKYSQDGPWEFPAGTVLVKHFDLVTDENTGNKRRLETRIIVVDSTGKNIYSVTYRWAPNGTNATLVPRVGDSEDITIATSFGTNRVQKWTYPARTGELGCSKCHNDGVGVGATLGVLGVKTAQLNGSLFYKPSGVTDNQLRTLNHLELFSDIPGGVNLDAAVTKNGTLTIDGQPQMAQFGNGINNTAFNFESRVRSYLDANCAHCHGAKRKRDFDGRFTTAFKDQNIAATYLKFSKTLPDKTKDIRIYGRDADPGTGRGQGMPPLARQLVDAQWIGLVENYITMSFNLVLVTSTALDKITLVFDSNPENATATVPGNYKLSLVSNPGTVIGLKPNPVLSANTVTFDLASPMTKKVKYKVTVTGDVFDTSNPKNRVWPNRFVEFNAPDPNPRPNVDDGSAPANDNFASPALLTGISATDTGFNCYATKETGEPDHAGNPGSNSVWWVWVATNSGPVTVDTFGSDFDTLLAVYTGGSVSTLTPVASNNDADDENLPANVDPTTGSFLSFNAVAGQTYYIAVDGQNDGYFTQCGNIQLHLQATPVPQGPPNDAFAAAFAITNAGGIITASNVLATKEDGEPYHTGDPGGASVWWRWTAPSDGLFSLDTHGSSFDTMLAVYLGNNVSNLTEVIANDDDSGLLTSSVQFSAASGTTYSIAVDGYGGQEGTIVLNYAFAPSPMTILPSLQLVSGFMILPADDGAFHLQIDGPAGALVEVQASDDLLHWSSAGMTTLTGQSWIFSDPFGSGQDHRFYRVVRHLN